jgi:hypothetical protein
VSLPPAERVRLNLMQALEDAIDYRQTRLTLACPDCPPGDPRCDDHDGDIRLVASYRQRHDAISASEYILLAGAPHPPASRA